MSDLNSVQLFGRVVRNAELKHSSDGRSVALFSLAVTDSFKNSNGEWENRANFFTLAIYGNYAEKMSSHLTKGRKAIIEGSLRQNRWEKNGNKYSSTEISVRGIHLIFDSKKDSKNDVADDGKMDCSPESGESFDFTEEQLAELYSEENETVSSDVLF